MLDLISKEIKEYFLVVFIIGIIAFFLGLILDIKYIYIAYTIGILFSLIANSYLLYTTYRVVYKYESRKIMTTRYIVSFIIYAISMYLTSLIIKDKYAIIANALGLLTFRIVIYIYQLLKKILRK